MRLNHYTILAFFCLTALLCFPDTASAQFSGYYQPGNWTFAETPTGTGGSVSTGGAPASVTLVSGDMGIEGVSAYSIVMPAAGTVTFSWSYTTSDGAQYDYPQYSINGGTPVTLPGYNMNSGTTPQSGTASIPVAAGDIFSLIMYTADGQAGPGTTVFSNFTAPVALQCTGAPGVPAATGPAFVCLNAPFTLSVTGATAGLGISYQWEFFNTGTSTWDPIPGGTGPSVTISSGQTTATDYRFVTTCANGGANSFSNTVSVGMNPFSSCYCSPNTGTTLHSYSWNYINNVTITGTALNSSNTSTPVSGYLQLSPTIATNTASLTQGVQYTMVVTTVGGIDPGLWIDFDQSGSFNTGEFIPSTSVSGNTATYTFIVPITATPGQTGMRVRAYYSTFSASDPCYDPYDGETEDYVIDIIQAVPCSGLPNVATVNAPATVCQNSSFTLSATNFSTGIGISYQWEVFNTATSSWDPIAGATNPTYQVAGGQSTATDYRFVTTCANGGGVDFSNPVTIGMSPFYNCYCVATNQGSSQITNVTIPGTTFNNTSGTAPAPAYYNSFSPVGGATATLIQGQTYTISTTYAGSSIGSVWVDFDQDGTFSASEWTQLGTTGSAHTATFTVPVGAIPGQTGMRVRSRNSGSPNGAGDACLAMGSGETEDYIITIDQAIACTGAPNIPVAAGPASVCSGVPFTLSATGISTGLGISYQWESFNVGTSNWDPIPGATNPTFIVSSQTAATDYRLVTTCSNGGGSSFSNVLNVLQNAPNQCYCASNFTDVSYEHITNVDFAGINNSTGGVTGGPVDFTAQVGNVTPGVPSTMSVTILADGSEYVYAFFDWDQNGVLDDAGEVYTVASNVSANGPHVITITPPVTALPGNTRMRVMLDYANPIPDPCSNATYGEAEDYTINVSAPPACLPPGNLAAAVTGSTANVSWDPVNNASGYEWAVDQSSTPAPDASTTVNTSTTTTPAAVTGLSASSTYYLHVRSDCGSVNGYSAWAVYSFSTPPPNDECVNAINISNSQLFNGVTTGAIQTMAACDATTNANDVWYTITTGSVAGSVTVNVNTTVGDIVMELFSGTCGSFTGLVPTASANSATTSCVDQFAVGLDWATYTLAANTTYYVRVYGYNGANSTFTIEALGTPLAVKLSEISATNVGKRNRVDWITASETAGDRFELERSADGRNFTQLSTINARGEASTYSYWDEKPVAGINYYRLKMMDAAGSFTYSDVVTAKVAGSGAFTVEAYPNPVGEMLTVKVYGAAGNNPTVSVSDITGKVIKVVTVTNNEATINMSGLAQGMYLVKYTDNNNTETIKVNKK